MSQCERECTVIVCVYVCVCVCACVSDSVCGEHECPAAFGNLLQSYTHDNNICTTAADATSTVHVNTHNALNP